MKVSVSVGMIGIDEGLLCVGFFLSTSTNVNLPVCPERAFLAPLKARQGDDASIASHQIRAGSTVVHY